MISFELKRVIGDVPDEIEVYLDHAGLESLCAQLRFLEAGETDHVHLLAESWGGSHLFDQPFGAGNTSIRSVKVLIQEHEKKARNTKGDGRN